MASFFPREVIQWRDQRLHPLRAFSLSTLEMAGTTGVVLRLFRALTRMDSISSSWVVFVLGVVVGALFLCGMLTWHLGNFPLRRWPVRVAFFALIEWAAELGMSSVLIAVKREPLGSRVAVWHDWWGLAGQTLVERPLVIVVYTLILAGCVQLVRRILDRKRAVLPMESAP
jgi:type III secretory pathway component EscS